MTILRPCIDTNTGAPAYIIAAADTPALLKARADVVCDGTNDEAQINTAFTTYDTVVLCEGTFNIDDTITMASGKTLRGSLGTVLIDVSENAYMILNSDSSGGNTNIVIEGITFDGGGVGAGQPEGINFTKVGPNDDAKGATIRNCVFQNFYDNPIYLLSCYNSDVADNVYIDNIEPLYLQNCVRCRVTGNIVHNTNAYGINLRGCNDCEVNDNSSTESTYSGIFMYQGSDNLVANNRCAVNGREGIELNTEHHTSIVDNKCNDNSQTTDATYDGIYLTASDYCLIQGNTVRKGALANHHRYGINISGATCDNNTVEGNDLYASGDTGDLNDTGTATNKRNNIALAGGWLANDIALTALATQAAQTVNANATDGAAAPTAIAIASSQIVARLAAGNLKGCSVAEIVTLLLACQTTGFTMSGDVVMGDKDITGLCEATFTEEHANTSSSGAVTINWATNGPKQKLTLEASTATTATFTAPSGPCNMILRVIQHASFGGTIIWPVTVMWPDKTAPTLTDTASAEDIIAFYWNGTNYYGCMNPNFGVPA